MNIAKTGAAFGLAALTLASSLSLGAAANAAPAAPHPKTANDSKIAEGHVLTSFVAQNPDGTYWAATSIADNAGYTYLERTPNGSAQSAYSQAMRVQIPTPGTSGYLLTEDGANCIYAANVTDSKGRLSSGVSPVDSATCKGPRALMEIGLDGSVTNNYFTSSTLTADKFEYVATPGVAFTYGPQNLPQAKLVFTNAETKSVDVYDRTAEIEGYAQPNSKITVKGANFQKTVTTGADGSWKMTVEKLTIDENKFSLESKDASTGESLGTSEFVVDVKATPLSATVVSTDLVRNSAQVEITGTPGAEVDWQGKSTMLGASGVKTVNVTGLDLGGNNVTFNQAIDSEYYGDPFVFNVMLTVADLTVGHDFSTDNAKDLTLKGKAQGGATITIVDKGGKTTTTEANGQGMWEKEVPAPGARQQTFTVHQSIGSATGEDVEHEVDYGNAVDITFPGDGSDFDGGDLTLRGDGQIDAGIEVLENGKVVTTAKGNNSDKWTATVEDVTPGQEHKYTVRQLSKGNLTTEDTITINPGQSNEAPDVVLTNPANPADGYEEGKPFTFKGTARPGSQVTVQNIYGTVFATVSADEQTGEWEYTRPNMGTFTWMLDFVADKGTAQQKTAELRDFKPTPATGTPVKITNPAKASDGYEAGKPFTFKGTARPGSTVTIENIYGTQFGTADANPTTGEWEFTRANMGTYTWMLNFIADKGTNDQKTGELRDFKPNPDAGTPVKITNPADPAVGYEIGKPFTFKGTARPGSTVTIENIYGTQFGTADANPTTGEWEFTRANMGTYTWMLDFIADKGDSQQKTGQLRNFAPKP